MGIGVLIALRNAWLVFQKVRRKRTGEITPLLGGLLLFVGMFMLTGSAVHLWAFLGLFIDLGSFPYLVYSVIQLAKKK